VSLFPSCFSELTSSAEVLAHPADPVIRLGRDVLNQHRIVVDGPRLALEIE
jgi:hypothetical protein